MYDFYANYDAFEEELASDNGTYEPFRPEQPGEMCVGRLLEFRHITTEYGPLDIAILRDKAGVKRSVALTSTALKNEFNRLRPIPGDMVGVKFLGKATSKKSGREFTNWVVHHIPAHGPRYRPDGEPRVSDAEIDARATEEGTDQLPF